MSRPERDHPSTLPLSGELSVVQRRVEGRPAPGRPEHCRWTTRFGRAGRTTRWLCAVAFVISLAAASAQEGHPLVGTWYGDWGPTPQARHDVTVIMTWDGKTIGGTIDPGPDAVLFTAATLDSSTWTVHIEAERPVKGATAAVRYVIDGKLANLGSYNRTLSGTWTDGASKGDFKLTRD